MPSFDFIIGYLDGLSYLGIFLVFLFYLFYLFLLLERQSLLLSIKNSLESNSTETLLSPPNLSGLEKL